KGLEKACSDFAFTFQWVEKLDILGCGARVKMFLIADRKRVAMHSGKRCTTLTAPAILNGSAQVVVPISRQVSDLPLQICQVDSLIIRGIDAHDKMCSHQKRLGEKSAELIIQGIKRFRQKTL